MPARIALSDKTILKALEETGGHVAAAATRLGISSKTLRRRLATNRELRLGPPVHPVWKKALEGDAAVRDGSDPSMRGKDAFTRYINRLEGDGGWIDDETEGEPRVLSDEEVADLASLLADSESDWYLVDPVEQLRDYKPVDHDKALEKAVLSWCR